MAPTDPAVWIEDYLLHVHMARGDDLHAIKYLPLKLKGPARHWLNSFASRLNRFLGGPGSRIPRQLPGHLRATAGCRRLKPHNSAARGIGQVILDTVPNKEKPDSRLSGRRGPSSLQA